MNNGWVVEIQPGCWLATWNGDPGRTELREYARQYKSAHAAECALRAARRYRPLEGALVYQDDNDA